MGKKRVMKTPVRPSNLPKPRCEAPVVAPIDVIDSVADMDPATAGCTPSPRDSVQESENENVTPTDGPIQKDEAHDALIQDIELRYDAAHRELIGEKRVYDFFVNRISKRLVEEKSASKSVQADLQDMLGSVRQLIGEIESIRADPTQFENRGGASRARGPPLPPQSELFAKARFTGQAKADYQENQKHHVTYAQGNYQRSYYN